MRKIGMLLVLFGVLLLSSCRMVVEDYLVAPSLTADQSAIIKCVEASSDERTVLKYPAGGDWRTPIQLIDLDNDGATEAVVFYTAPSEGLNARLAVLEKSAGEWQITSVLDGAGTDVISVRTIELRTGDARYLLVEWSSINTAEQRLAVYNYIDGELNIGLDEASSAMIVADLDDDGLLEFCYITAAVPDEFFRLKFVDNTGDGFAPASEVVLNPEMVSGLNLLAERTTEGRQLVYVDEYLDSGLNCTELFLIEGGRIAAANADEDYSIPLLSLREADTLISRSFGDGRVLIPSDVVPRETIADAALWKYWYEVSGTGIAHAMTSYVNASFNLVVGIPDEWLEHVLVAESEEDARRFLFSDVESEEVLFEIKVLTVNDDAKTYEDEGFEMISSRTSGAYRYYIRANCSAADRQYIVSRFYGVTA